MNTPKNNEHDIRPEAIKAAREGGHFCHECKGYGEIRSYGSWDFTPKEPHGYFWSECKCCDGTGIEPKNNERETWEGKMEGLIAQIIGISREGNIAPINRRGLEDLTRVKAEFRTLIAEEKHAHVNPDCECNKKGYKPHREIPQSEQRETWEERFDKEFQLNFPEWIELDKELKSFIHSLIAEERELCKARLRERCFETGCWYGVEEWGTIRRSGKCKYCGESDDLSPYYGKKSR